MDTRRWIEGWQRLGRWRWALAGVVVLVLVGVAAVVADGDDDDTIAGGPGTTERTSTTTSTSTTEPTTTTTSPATTTTAIATTAPPGPVPGAVTVVTAGPSAGSGEVSVKWDAVADAAGYRVLRSPTEGGQFETIADFNVKTGTTTVADDVIVLRSENHYYVRQLQPFPGPDGSPWFELIDVGGARRCFRIVAYNAAGEAPPSAVTCGSPPGVQ